MEFWKPKPGVEYKFYILPPFNNPSFEHGHYTSPLSPNPMGCPICDEERVKKKLKELEDAARTTHESLPHSTNKKRKQLIKKLK